MRWPARLAPSLVPCLASGLLASGLLGCGLVFDPSVPPNADSGVGAMDASIDADLDADLDTGLDAATERDCSRASDGTECARDPRFICRGGHCQPSLCGDGFVDHAAGEACEPTLGTECTDTCQLQCESDDDCSSGDVCTLSRCTAGICEFTTLADGDSCLRGGGLDGRCRHGVCAPIDCGDGVVSHDEECEGAPSEGCVACRFACHDDAECSDGDACNGTETCAAVTVSSGTTVGRRCVSNPLARTCFPMNGCEEARCVSMDGEAVCVREPIDRDGDGVNVCEDCDDDDPDVHPGAIEVCNGQDDNCNGAIDEDTGLAAWCRDLDGDGHGDPTTWRMSCEPPAGSGWVRNCDDCWDTDHPDYRAQAALVHPGQAHFFTAPFVRDTGASSFDYDCDGSETLEHTETASCDLVQILLCERQVGWTRSVPTCGVEDSFTTCRAGVVLCSAARSRVTQGCR